TELGQPDVKLAIAIGKEGDERAIGRDFGASLGSLPIREPGELRVGERVLLRRRASKLPDADACGKCADSEPRSPHRASATRLTRFGKGWQHFVDCVDLDPRIADGLQPLPRIFVQTSPKQPVYAGGRLTWKRRPLWSVSDNSGEHICYRIAAERRTADEHL